MALTRARIVQAPQSLRQSVDKVISQTLRANVEPAKVIADARDMRQKLAAQFSAANPWDLKFASGGLVDIEFIAQTLQLCTAPRGGDVLDTNTLAALKKLGAAGALSTDDSNTLQSAASLQQALTQALRIALDGTLDPATATPGLKGVLVRAAGLENFSELELKLSQAQESVRQIFTRLPA